MAGVLDALASYVTNMLTEMAKEEVAMLIGVSSGIEDLGVKLGDLKNFLADADRRNITDQAVQVWVNELKRAMYNATDILDLCQLKVMEQGPSTDRGCLNPLLFCMRNPLHARDIGNRIKALNEKLDGIYKRGHSFNFIKLEAYQDRKTIRPPPTSRKTDPLLERSGVAGEKIEEDTRVLVRRMLTKEIADKSPLVVAIVGVGGIGKTTLGKKVFNDPAIQGKFSKKIWLSITQDFSEVELLRTAITATNEDLLGPGGGAQDKALLVPALANAIRDKKFFLVLDDMWGTNEWNHLLKAPFSHGAPGSRVLVTTRDDIVARGMKAVHPYHHVDKLGPEDAWLLLQKQVVTNEESEPEIDMLKDIGLEIISKCDGLPLAIKVMGGLLCQREKERRDWENVLSDVIRSVSEMPEELNYAIYLSYEDLPPCLKQCFLHFSLKPKRTGLDVDEIVGMWIAEGFIHGNSDILENLGSKYYKELISRNLVEPDAELPSHCVGNMHDVVRSFAQSVARDEALVVHNGEIDSKLSLGRFLRLSVETKGVGSDEFEWRFLHEQKSLRTLVLIGNCKIQSNDSLLSFSSLRSLHIESTHFDALVESLYQLKHLRYLAVIRTDISRLPENIDKMKFLQYIILVGCESFVQLPGSIIKLRALRCLDMEGTRVNSMPRGFCALTNLRVLFGFRAHMDGDWCSLEELGPLSQLKRLELEGLENVSANRFAVKARLGAKVYLTYLAFSCSSRVRIGGFVRGGVSEEEQQRIEEVLDELHPLPCLEILYIIAYIGRQFPRWITSTATTPLKSLTTVIMIGLACCTQLPDGLCHLPNLGFLRVEGAPAIKRVGPEFVGAYNQCHHPSSQAAAAFPRLHQMRLYEMVEWEEWEWEEEVRAMPILEELTLQRCKLGRIPRGLASHARALKKLTIWNVQRLHSLENFVSVVELDLYDIPDLARISNFPKLQKLDIQLCPKLESLQEMTALRRLLLTVYYSEERLPLYLQTVKPSHLLLDCSPEILASMAAGKSGLEWDKFSHIKQVEAFAYEKKWHVLYTSEPYKMETNIEANPQRMKQWMNKRRIEVGLRGLGVLFHDQSEDEAEDE